jgi:hypothetical protein
MTRLRFWSKLLFGVAAATNGAEAMAKSTKKFRLSAAQIRPLAEGYGGCIATDQITVQGRPVGYMYREEPRRDHDSGWCFTAGDESEGYMNTAENLEIYDINTIANYDPEIIPFLDAPPGSAFARNPKTGHFEEVAFEPTEE